MSNVNDVYVNMSSSNIEIDYKFVYNVYEENETQLNDNIINFNREGLYLPKYVEMRVFIKGLRSGSFYNVESDNDDLVSSLLDKESLTIEERSYFNNISKLDASKLYFNSDINSNNVKEKLLEKYYDLDSNSSNFNLDDENIGKYYNENSLTAIRKSIKTSISKEFLEEISENEKNSKIQSNKKLSDIGEASSLIFNKSVFYNVDFDFFEAVKEGNLFPNFVAYEEEASPDDKSHEKLFIGYLVDKYKKNEGDKYDYLTSSFRSLQEGDLNYTFFIRDNSINYGSKYRYVIYPVFKYLAIIPGNYNVDGYTLICETPSITEDIDCQEFKRPPYPVGIRGKFFQKDNNFLLRWEVTNNKQNDIKGFQIFRRASLEEPYILVKQIESHSITDFYKRNENITDSEVIRSEKIKIYEFLDKDFKPSGFNIYTICSIDSHGYVSNYSDQIAFTYDYFNKKLIYDLVSRAGAPLFYPNLLVPRKTVFFNNDDKIVTNTPTASNKKKFTLMATPDAYTFSRNNGSASLERVYNKNDTANSNTLESIETKYVFNIFRVNNRTLFRDEIKILEE